MVNHMQNRRYNISKIDSLPVLTGEKSGPIRDGKRDSAWNSYVCS